MEFGTAVATEVTNVTCEGAFRVRALAQHEKDHLSCK